MRSVMNIWSRFEGEYVIESVIDRCDSRTSTQRWNKPCEEKYREICNVRARWHLGKEKKSQDSRDVARRANIFRRFSNFSSVHKQEELASREVTTLGHSFYDAVEPLFHRASSRSSTGFVPSDLTFRRLSWHLYLGISPKPVFYSGYLGFSLRMCHWSRSSSLRLEHSVRARDASPPEVGTPSPRSMHYLSMQRLYNACSPSYVRRCGYQLKKFQFAVF